MNYQTFQPHSDLESMVKCYWTLEVPSEESAYRQCIVPDGCIELIFILGDDIKRFTSQDEFVLQPRAMVLGPITEPFYIEPTGYVNSFAIRFYPYGFTNLVSTPITELANKETPIDSIFGEELSKELVQKIQVAADTSHKIRAIEIFLLERLNSSTIIDNIVQTTIETLLLTSGRTPIKAFFGEDLSKRRQLERRFRRQIGLSPKQLSKVIRLQTALKLLLNKQPSDSLTKIAYESEYYDQAHFIRDFKEFTGVTPKQFSKDQEMVLSTLFYK